MAKDRITEQPNLGDATVGHPKWFRIYYALAILDLVAVLFSLALSHHLMGIHAQSLASSREIAELRSLAGTVNAPGNDVFDSQDVPTERKRMRVAIPLFKEQLKRISARTDSLPPLPHLLPPIEIAFEEMVRESTNIFLFLEQQDVESAGKRMATMDRCYANTQTAIANLSATVDQLSNKEAQSLRKFEYIITILVCLMIFGAVYYGHQIQRQIKSSESTRMNYLAGLKTANRELLTQIAERQRAERSLRLVESAIAQINDGVVIAPADELPTSPPEYLNPGFFKILCLPPEQGFNRGLTSLFGSSPMPDHFRAAWDAARTGTHQTFEVSLTRGDGTEGVIDWNVTPIRNQDGRVSSVVLVLRDLTEQKSQEAQRHQGQKMESIGQLAAGVAHEINTPIQFIGDNLRFLGDSFGDLTTVLAAHGKLLGAARSGAPTTEVIAATDAADKRADIRYLSEEIPKALSQSLEGITRVADIIRAMKEFSHPDQGEKKPTDLNKSITTTLTVARNEYKYVADLVTDFAADLPPVPCIAGEFNQVVLNLLVNAAHAIGDVVAKAGGVSGGKGTITVSTRRDGDHVEVRIRDTGTGIPEAARAKIFDPFFTTKAVGKGTGQGLHIAHTVVVKKHGGTLTFETEMGKGTTFIIRLPITP